MKYFITVLLLVAAAHSVPVYYTFEGKIDHSSNHTEAKGLRGSQLSFTFLIDTERNGYLLQNDGTKNYFQSSDAEFFTSKQDYASLKSKLYLQGSKEQPIYFSANNYYQMPAQQRWQSQILGGYFSHFAYIDKNSYRSGEGIFIEEWEVGDSFNGFEYSIDILDPDQTQWINASRMRLVEITPVAAPEPNVFLLFMIGSLLLLSIKFQQLQADDKSV